mmetsp:Transcript_27710/g.51754  ORF Transcript_27710/g.51754 Transcript_27710/m.51754 type:complete len:503 (+) Transcript_27710:193-1701(+)
MWLKSLISYAAFVLTAVSQTGCIVLAAAVARPEVSLGPVVEKVQHAGPPQGQERAHLSRLTRTLWEGLSASEAFTSKSFQHVAGISSTEPVSSNLTTMLLKGYDSDTCGGSPDYMLGTVLTNYGCVEVVGNYVKIHSCSQSSSSTIDIIFNTYSADDCSSDSYLMSSSFVLGGTGCFPAPTAAQDSVDVVCDTSNQPWTDDMEGLTLLVYQCEDCEQGENGEPPVSFLAYDSAGWECTPDRDGLYYSAWCSEGQSYTHVAYADSACTQPLHEDSVLLSCDSSELTGQFSTDVVGEFMDDDSFDYSVTSHRGFCSTADVTAALTPLVGKTAKKECPVEDGDDDFCFHVESKIDYKGVKYSYEDLQAGKEPECSIPHSPFSKGVIISTICGKTARVTDTHLMATTKGFQLAYSLKAGDVLFGDYHQEQCTVTSVQSEEVTQQYFGLNCVHSEVLVSGLRASTFGDFHALPSWYMSYVGGVLGSEVASSIGVRFAALYSRFMLMA